jgi:hypothetical protein
MAQATACKCEISVAHDFEYNLIALLFNIITFWEWYMLLYAESYEHGWRQLIEQLPCGLMGTPGRSL